MIVAIRWQEPRTAIGARAVAAITALWLLVAEMLSAHHLAETQHVRDATDGVYHASSADREASRDEASRLRDRASGAHDHRACHLAAGSHPTSAAVPAAKLVTGGDLSRHAMTVHRRRLVDEPCLYRLAPKTSPPLA